MAYGAPPGIFRWSVPARLCQGRQRAGFEILSVAALWHRYRRGSPQEEQGELVPGEPLLDEVTPVFNGLRVCFSVHSRVRDQPLV
jgi:hypothetical protein